MKELPPAPPELTLPAALLWVCKGVEAITAARHDNRSRPGVEWLRPDLCAVVPTAGDAAVFDAAAGIAAELLARSTGTATAGDGRRPAPHAFLILPGRVRVAGDGLAEEPDPLLDDLARRPPEVGSGTHLTGYAATRLELRHRVARSGVYDGPSGSRVPLFELLEEEGSRLPWRNPELLRRGVAYVPRPALDDALLPAPPALRVCGPLGCGKTRTVYEALAEAAAPLLWLNCRPARHGGPSLVAQLVALLLRDARATGRRLPELVELGLVRSAAVGGEELSLSDLLRPGAAPPQLADVATVAPILGRWLERSRPPATGLPTVVCDDLEAATEGDLELLAALREAAGSRRFRLILVGRGGAPWSAALESAPEIRVPPLAGEEMEGFARHAFDGLSLPDALAERVVTFAGGRPFVVEEALVALLHRRQIRQVYGSFFFGGDPEAAVTVSDRLVQHVEAEARRLGQPDPLRALALAETPLPDAVLARLTAAPEGWAQPYREADLLGPVPSPWGEGLEIAAPAFGLALTTGVRTAEADRLRHALGDLLDSPTAESSWWRYRLLAGTSQALEPLHAAVRGEAASAGELLAALRVELEAHRQRQDDPDEELELLWSLLPLARRQGRLHELDAEVDRARRLAEDDAKRYLAFSTLLAEMAEEDGRLSEAEGIIREALKRWGIGREAGAALLVIRLGRLLIRQDRYQDARELLEPVEPILKSSRATSLHASCLFYLGNVALHQQRLEDALGLHRRSLTLRRRLERPSAIGASLSALGRVSVRLGSYGEALAAYKEAEEVLAEGGEAAEVSFALLGIGMVLGRLGDYTAASAPLRKALALREESEDVVGHAITRLAVAENHLHLEHPTAALREARQAHFELRMLPQTPSVLGDAELLLGRILLRQRQVETACHHFARAVEIHRDYSARELLAFDYARWLEAALVEDDEGQIQHLTTQLQEVLSDARNAERWEILELYLWRGLQWLERAGGPREPSLPHLRRAYRGLLRKVELLPPERRHRFLFQIPEHEAIVTAATQAGLSFPEMALPGSPPGM